uniref:Uncharacterized protein n=1 Tax=Chelonoidis abingdonii TaxID=106734 RepID=A0A8C0JE53_CHEAB
MSEQGKLNQETVEETAKEQESAISDATPENCIINKTESLEAEEKEEKLSDAKTDLQVRRKRTLDGAKGKLVRSLAVCEESSPRLGILENSSRLACKKTRNKPKKQNHQKLSSSFSLDQANKIFFK